jgi:hypothetical protein
MPYVDEPAPSMWDKVFQALEQPRYREIGQRYNRSRYCTVTGSFRGSAYINLQSARKGSKQACPLTSPKACKGCAEGLGDLASDKERVFDCGDQGIHNFPCPKDK